MLDKTYRPEAVETRQYEAWQRAGAFAADPASGKPPYTIMMPPPNVTGSLHMGHALTFTLQDILIRFERMRGRDALWQPGTDHAGIATEIVVGNQLADRQINKHDLGRDKFNERVWEWKAESGGTITTQLRRLGASADWSRERFTMDAGLSAAVRRVFVTLYKEGLIYRDKRLVNWDPVMHTVISDLEVDERETRGSLWHIRYPIEGQPGRFITVATTRPETMLGDTGVAVHPDDARYADLVGKQVRLPLVGRLIPIVADEYADPEMGSGAVKITPAHDFNDFKVGERHDLPLINIFDADARINDNAPQAYRGLLRFDARKKVVADLEAAGLIEKIEDHTLKLPHHDRSGEVIEPWLTDQWFCNAAALAGPAIEAVESGRTQFVPRQWENTFFEWMRNIQPWCISRQLWWGHQIPAWYGPDGAVFVAESEAEAQTEAASHYGGAVALIRDEDVLDTWFSSGLWPFSTLGWPDETPELARYYPADVLVTGFDIIFFWVARMMMQGLHFMGDVPFRTVYIHALVRDERGQKMSKSRGNIIDPLELIDRFGCDALRFTLAALASPGRDIKLSESRVESSRNFATKLWNAARYAEMYDCVPVPGFDPRVCRLTENRWIAGATRDCAAAVTGALEAYRFDEAAHLLYHFIWGTFCDWYLEFTKPILQGDDAAARAETQATTAWVLAQTLHLLHPVMPFITEELWRQFGGADTGMLITSRWPDLPPDTGDPSISPDRPEMPLREPVDGLPLGAIFAQAPSINIEALRKRQQELLVASEALLNAAEEADRDLTADELAQIEGIADEAEKIGRQIAARNRVDRLSAETASVEMEWVVAAISAIRAIRTEVNLPAGARLPLLVKDADPTAAARLERHREHFMRLARVDRIDMVDTVPEGGVAAIVEGATLILRVGEVIDLGREKARLAKEIGRLDADLARFATKLANPAFLAKAKAEVVDEQREREADARRDRERLQAVYDRIAAG